eukprot:1746091-Rhodomonas_salina.2
MLLVLLQKSCWSRGTVTSQRHRGSTGTAVTRLASRARSWREQEASRARWLADIQPQLDNACRMHLDW